ncbi:unnamed protein product [Choristocarpus tenellus]
MIVKALTLRILYVFMNDEKNRQTALEMAAGYAMARVATVSKWERNFLTKGHIKVSEQGRYERHFVLGLNEDIIGEVKEWVREHIGRKGGFSYGAVEVISCPSTPLLLQQLSPLLLDLPPRELGNL